MRVTPRPPRWRPAPPESLRKRVVEHAPRLLGLDHLGGELAGLGSDPRRHRVPVCFLACPVTRRLPDDEGVELAEVRMDAAAGDQPGRSARRCGRPLGPGRPERAENRLGNEVVALGVSGRERSGIVAVHDRPRRRDQADRPEGALVVRDRRVDRLKKAFADACERYAERAVDRALRLGRAAPEVEDHVLVEDDHLDADRMWVGGDAVVVREDLGLVDAVRQLADRARASAARSTSGALACRAASTSGRSAPRARRGDAPRSRASRPSP